jgi:hypothetical protein
MKKILLFVLPLLLTTIATGQAERVFVKSFNLFGRQTLVLNLGENIQIVPTDNDIVRVQMTVKLANANDALLKAIAETGRYILKSDMTVHDISVTAPGLLNELKLNGNIINETITYMLFIPKNITVLRNENGRTKVMARLNP